jgi:hypothetical protein
VAQLIKYEKKFVIIGHQNAITYKEIFPLIRDNKMWLGYGFKRNMAHFTSVYEDTASDLDHKEGMIRVSGVQWFTNLDISKRHEDLILYKPYSAADCPKFDLYDAIEVGITADIPIDYNGVIGVPITFLNKYNPDQFEIIGLLAGNIKGLAGIPSSSGKDGPYVGGKLKYGRILIRAKNGDV